MYVYAPLNQNHFTAYLNIKMYQYIVWLHLFHLVFQNITYLKASRDLTARIHSSVHWHFNQMYVYAPLNQNHFTAYLNIKMYQYIVWLHLFHLVFQNLTLQSAHNNSTCYASSLCHYYIWSRFLLTSWLKKVTGGFEGEKLAPEVWIVLFHCIWSPFLLTSWLK